MILVTGGTGFVGREVVRKLLDSGFRVRLLARHPERVTEFRNRAGIEICRGDALDPETLPAAVKEVCAVIHLIGVIAETSRVTFEQAHVEATRHVLAAAREAGATRWIQMSAIGTRPGASSRYHLTKWQAEELVRQSGLDWTVIRPSLIYGYDDRDRLLNLLRMAVYLPVFPVLNGGRTLIQPVSVREVAHCFARAVAEEESLGREYDLVGPEAFSWREMVFKVAHALGRQVEYENVPIRAGLHMLLWLAVCIMPILVVLGLVQGRLNFIGVEIMAALWTGLVLIAIRWRRLMVFNLPSWPLRRLGAILQSHAPRGLQFGEQLKMAEEDNVGDSGPAMKTFAYVPETFEQGLARLYRLE